MQDFLDFNLFITKYVLIVFYYFFAIAFPVVLYYFKDKLKIKIKNIKIWIVLIVLFFMGELFLRMFFEMLIGYFDMHDYLYEISQKMK